MPEKKKRGNIDRTLLLTVFIIVSIGFVMIYSSSGVRADKIRNDALFFIRKQVVWSFIGCTVLFVTSHIDYRFWRKVKYPFIFGTLALLVAVIMPQFGRRINGAMRWLSIGGITVQPSELAKISIVFYMADFIVRKGKEIRNFRGGLLPPLLLVGLFVSLIMKEPDLGTVIYLTILSGVMLFVAGARISHMFCLATAGVVAAAVAISSSSYRLARLMTFIDPWEDRTDSGFQIVQSLLAFGRGNIFGMGLGKGRQKLFFLPEIHTDFIFAFVGEELGFLGCVFIISLFLVIFWRGVLIARRVHDPFGRYLAYGLSYMIVLHVILNMGVVTGLLPTTGLPLPFLSYGGSSLVLNLAAVGILLNISRYKNRESM